MHRLNIYVGSTVLKAIALVLLIIVGLDAMTAFIDESQDSSDTYTFGQIGLYILLTLPGRFYEFIPFAALIGCLVGLGQLATSSELVVMRAAGVSVGRLVWTSMKPALLVAFLGFMIGEYVAPKTDQMAESRRALAQNPGDSFGGRYGIWNREGNTFLHINALEGGGIAHGITLLQFDGKQRLQTALRSPRATYQGDHWLMEKAVKTSFSSWETTRQRHNTLRWDTSITPDLLSMEVVSPEQLRLAELHRYGRYLRQQGLDADDYELAMWKKLLQPAAVGGLVLVAISFIFGPLREGTMGFRTFAGVIVGIVFQTSQDLLGPASLVFGFAPLYAALAPILVCFLVGLLLLARTR